MVERCQQIVVFGKITGNVVDNSIDNAVINYGG
jgi:hypothetical protein